MFSALRRTRSGRGSRGIDGGVYNNGAAAPALLRTDSVLKSTALECKLFVALSFHSRSASNFLHNFFVQKPRVKRRLPIPDEYFGRESASYFHSSEGTVNNLLLQRSFGPLCFLFIYELEVK